MQINITNTSLPYQRDNYDLLKTTISNQTLQKKIDSIIEEEQLEWRQSNTPTSPEKIIRSIIKKTKHLIKHTKASSGLISPRPTDIVLTESVLDHIFDQFAKNDASLESLKQRMAVDISDDQSTSCYLK